MSSHRKGHNPPIPSVARTYAEVLGTKPQDYWDYEDYTLEYGNQEHYELVRKIGRGKYSEVFEAVNVKTEDPCVIKVLKAVKRKKVKRETKILENLRGGPNIIKLLDIIRDPLTDTQCLALEYVANADYRQLYAKFSNSDIQFYMHRLLTALDYAHSHGIMHRDVKPHNIAIDPNKRILRLIDWGLAEFYFTCQEYNVRVASRYFKAPELLVDYVFYDYSLDMWSFGCIIAALIFRKDPFFQGADNGDQLAKIVKVLGTNSFRQYREKYHIRLDSKLFKLTDRKKKTPWTAFVDKTNCDRAIPSAIDLVDHLLRFDHAERLTAREALQHEYFMNVESRSPEDFAMDEDGSASSS